MRGDKESGGGMGDTQVQAQKVPDPPFITQSHKSPKCAIFSQANPNQKLQGKTAMSPTSHLQVTSDCHLLVTR